MLPISRQNISQLACLNYNYVLLFLTHLTSTHMFLAGDNHKVILAARVDRKFVLVKKAKR